MNEKKIKEIFKRSEVLQDKHEIKIDGGLYIPSSKEGASVSIKHQSTIIVYSDQLNELIGMFRKEGYEFVGIFFDENEVSADFVEETNEGDEK